MRAAFALLADRETHNLVQRLAWNAHCSHRTDTIDVRLPPLVSLKQSFHIDDLDAVEAYADELARSIQPFTVFLNELKVQTIEFGGERFGHLWIDVAESAQLRALHGRLYREMEQRFGGMQANFDGPAYRFHMTVAIGEQPPGVYKELLGQLPDRRIDHEITARELGMFVYDEPYGPHGEYLMYKILPLGIDGGST